MLCHKCDKRNNYKAVTLEGFQLTVEGDMALLRFCFHYAM